MSGAGGYKYHVIQFLEVPYKDVPDFVCVPRSWVQSCGPDIPIVKVSYPVEKPSFTEERVMNRKKKSDRWKSFLSVIRYSTDTYENAKIYIRQEINNSKKKKDFHVDGENIHDRTNKSEKKNGDHTLLSAKTNEKTSITTQNAMSRATIDNDVFLVGMLDALGWCVSSKSANTITLKRKSLPVSDKENRIKRLRVHQPDESDSQVAGPSSKALDWSDKNDLSPRPEDEDLCTPETPVEKFNDNSTEIRQTVSQNHSETTHSLDPKIITQLATSPMFPKWCMLMHELQEVYDNSMFKELINKLLNKDNNGSAALSDRTGEAPKLNKEKRNEKPLKEKDTDNDEDKDHPPENDDSSEEGNLDLHEDEELPPEYDANDSRWKLKYREPAPGNIELMNKDNNGSGPQNNDAIASVSSYTTVEAPKSNKEKRNEKPLEEKETDDNGDKDQPLEYDDSSEESDLDLDEDEELPPEYDANDSRWTLKYREPAPGNIELMPHTGVYMTNYKILPKRPIPLAKTLLRGIFTKNALHICLLTGTRAKAIDRHGTKVRPALDEHAITVLMNYVTDHAIEVVDSYYIQDILRSMRDQMRELRKYAIYQIKKKKYRLKI